MGAKGEEQTVLLQITGAHIEPFEYGYKMYNTNRVDL
jgi:hypothetical protein